MTLKPNLNPILNLNLNPGPTVACTRASGLVSSCCVTDEVVAFVWRHNLSAWVFGV